SDQSCTYTRVPMIASVRSCHAPRAGGGAAGAAATACAVGHSATESVARINLSMRVTMASRAKGTTSSRPCPAGGVTPVPGGYGILPARQAQLNCAGGIPMKLARLTPLLCGALVLAMVCMAPSVGSAKDADAGPVTCKDGTTSPHGGRGACSKHGGIAKSK